MMWTSVQGAGNFSKATSQWFRRLDSLPDDGACPQTALDHTTSVRDTQPLVALVALNLPQPLKRILDDPVQCSNQSPRLCAATMRM